jgi:hypothetical protein
MLAIDVLGAVLLLVIAGLVITATYDRELDE